jgi:hypothetical protein
VRAANVSISRPIARAKAHGVDRLMPDVELKSQ